ncbi:MAG TPA: CCA tRNA nucleotidyltransferase [Candidatus Limnocylindria bacterium]|nr:CCA tRNA nucleotidyltransferase [Candidatus Limnocylindria bacterium]
MHDGAPLTIDLPPSVRAVLARLAADGMEAALVGGSVRDLVTGATPTDWDVATAAPPERVAALFPGSSWENRFGTVTVRGDPDVEVTTYRHEGPYLDRRRPEHVRWGTSLADDLARRDFTVNAIAWRPADLDAGAGTLVDPYDGIGDLRRGVLRAVGDPAERFDEDALRMVRAVRFATRLGLALDPATDAAIVAHAGEVASLSGERVRDELLRMLRASSPAAPPSAALALMERLGLLTVLLPELAALRGVPQAKALRGDALDHSLRTADALPADRPVLRLAGLLHDLGKATTLADGHFIGHDVEGARMAEEVLHRLRLPRTDATWVVRLVRQHMFAYIPAWTDAAVRRFVRRVGADLLDDLFALRAADNAASGAREPATGGMGELRGRVAQVLASDALEQGQLAIDGNDLVAELGAAPGPQIGELLRRLLEAVLDDPSQNTRERLLALARGWQSEPGASEHRQDGGPEPPEGADDGPAATIGDPGAVPT